MIPEKVHKNVNKKYQLIFTLWQNVSMHLSYPHKNLFIILGLKQSIFNTYKYSDCSKLELIKTPNSLSKDELYMNLEV